MRDVSERRSLEGQLYQAQKLTSLGQLANGIAHDFRTVVNVIQGNLEILSSLRDPTAAAPVITDIVAATRRAADFTAQLLMFAKGEAPRLRAVDVSEVARSTVDLLVRSVRGRPVEVHVPDAPLRVVVDESMLHQVVLNLLVNAREAVADVAEPRIVLTVRRADVDDGDGAPQLELVVEDNGCGIAPADLDAVFEPFFTTRGEGHSGLGLSTAAGIVRDAGGTLRAESEVGGGTRMIVRLPVVDEGLHVDDEPAAREPAAPPSADQR
jgi:signal transduction histidine kinase